MVETPSGERPIAALHAGDHVIAYDPPTGKATTQTVEQVFLNHDHDRLDVTLAYQIPAAATAAASTIAVGHGRAAPTGQGQLVATATSHATRDEVIHTTIDADVDLTQADDEK